ncbi:MAG: MarR family transcriptional regulator [Daejeonella sp.]
MKIEKEISNNKFSNNFHKTVVNILYTYSWLTNLLTQRLDKYDITLQQYNILRILRGQYPNPATVNLLKERMLDKMSDASRIVERLVQKKLVNRAVSERDRRAVDIVINAKGLEVLKNLDTEMDTEQILNGHLSSDEAGELSDLLDKMRG